MQLPKNLGDPRVIAAVLAALIGLVSVIYTSRPRLPDVTPNASEASSTASSARLETLTAIQRMSNAIDNTIAFPDDWKGGKDDISEAKVALSSVVAESLPHVGDDAGEQFERARDLGVDADVHIRQGPAVDGPGPENNAEDLRAIRNALEDCYSSIRQPSPGPQAWLGVWSVAGYVDHVGRHHTMTIEFKEVDGTSVSGEYTSSDKDKANGSVFKHGWVRGRATGAEFNGEWGLRADNEDQPAGGALKLTLGSTGDSVVAKFYRGDKLAQEWTANRR